MPVRSTEHLPCRSRFSWDKSPRLTGNRIGARSGFHEGRHMPANVSHFEGTEHQRNRAFSPAVITEGGKTIWLAGQTATTDESGNDISGKFEEQARTCFALIEKTLARSGASLSN